MFVAHFAVGFACKRFAPKASLGTLLLAPLLLDALWPLFLLTGLESVRIDPGNTRVTPLDLHDYPYSHSLLMAVVWSLAFAVGYFFVRRQVRAAWVLGLGVFSHWLLDFVSHRPDMPLFPGSQSYVGLGLWNSLPATLVVELALFALGVALYERTTRSANRVGQLAWYALLVVLCLIYAGAVFGPPPPSVGAIIASGFAGWLFVPWAAWIDRNRISRESPA
jgi:membrane-bound metal-dependent hydrolase YbcI (DUF457 family)